METIEESDVQSAIAAGRLLGGLESQVQTHAGSVPFVLLPKEVEPRSVEALLPAPMAVRAVVSFDRLESFNLYLTEFGGADTLVFVSVTDTGASFTAVLDYHGAPAKEYAAKPSWCKHRAVYAAKLTPDWRAWMKMTQLSAIGQQVFADFIEDNAEMIESPDTATILEMTRNLQATRTAVFRRSVRKDGGEQVSYDEETKVAGGVGGGTIDVLDTLVVGLPPFDGGDKFKVRFRVRVRVQEQHLSLTLVAVQAEKVIRAAVDDMVKAVCDYTKFKPLYGTPPAAQ